jgi:hypothetical protein
MATEIDCALVIIGGGYAGVCALNAAVQHLTPGERVVVVDQGKKWGGQWVDQYDFVRLHQPFPIFTAGQRAWAISGTKPAGHLATKAEIIAHLEDIVTAATKESKIDLVPLFGYSYDDHAVTNGVVQLTVNCRLTGATNSGADMPSPPGTVLIRAKRMIKATGLDIQMKQPLPFSSPRVVSICPADVLQPTWNAVMRSPAHRDKPIYIIGSGKTAMDCIYHLSKDEAKLEKPLYRDRLHCISGRGMMFANRDVMFPNNYDLKTLTFMNAIAPDQLRNIISMYNGENEEAVLESMSKRGFFHSAIPDAKHW